MLNTKSTKKSLKIPKGYSVAVNRRTDNKMANQRMNKHRSTKHYRENLSLMLNSIFVFADNIY